MNLYPYQQEAVEWLFEHQRAILADDTGLGKTIEAIALAKFVEAQRILVVCRAGLKNNWQREIQKWYSIAPVTVLDGPLLQRQQEIRDFDVGFLVADYEAIRPEKKVDLLSDLLRHKWDIIIVDEAHWLCNRKSQQSVGARKLLRHAHYVLLMTATYIRNQASDVWHLLHLCNPKGFSSYWRFAEEHLNAHQGKYGWVVERAPVDAAAFGTTLTPYVFQRTKEQVRQDLPPVTIQQLWVNLESEQLRVYSEMEEEMVAQIGEEDDLLIAPIVLAQITRLKQICSSPKTLGIKEWGAKFEAISDIIDGTNQRIVIFSQFVTALQDLAEYLELDIEESLLAGSKYMSSTQQDAVVQNFQSPLGPQVLLAGMQAGGEGHTLTAASIGIFLDKHYTPAVHKQCIGRLDRDGQTQPVTIIEVLADSSVERWIEDMNLEKISLVEGVAQRVKRKLQKVI